jgi:hypothetical protein
MSVVLLLLTGQNKSSVELDHVTAESLKQLSLMGERALVNGSASPTPIGHLDNNDFYS